MCNLATLTAATYQTPTLMKHHHKQLERKTNQKQSRWEREERKNTSPRFRRFSAFLPPIDH
jgi:hypothetical protein